MAVTESALQDAIRLELGQVPGLVLWRNNCGTATRDARTIRFGVGGPGGSDLIGCYRGRFVALEIKTATGRLTVEQVRFAELVSRLGGEHAVLRSVQDALAWVAELRVRHG